jgi:hypothetical protein
MLEAIGVVALIVMVLVGVIALWRSTPERSAAPGDDAAEDGKTKDTLWDGPGF